MKNKKFIFLGGLHRSGTSLFFNILKSHPEVSGFSDTGVIEDEGQFLQTVFPNVRKYGGPGRFGFNRYSFLNEKSDLVSRENAEKLYSEWGEYWDLDCKYLVEKSPPTLVRSRFLQALFPKSYFIMLLRHPVAVAIATQKWSRTPLDSLIEHWLLCHERFADDKPHLSRLHIVKYESLVTDPDTLLADTSKFLGLDNIESGKIIKSDINKKYFDRWHELLKQKPKKGKKIKDKFELRLNKFGYSLDNPDLVEDVSV